MDKQEFADGLRARVDEIKEMEGLVSSYAQSIRGKSGLLRASMIVAYRKGIVDLLDMLDKKAIDLKKKKDAVNKITQDTRG